MECMALSIVVPIYQVGKYLSDCIDSIIINEKQEYYEILLVDDGSTDESGLIADKYADKYENIYAFHKVNGGLSDARNYGLSRSKGKYVFFMDADDLLNHEGIETILEHAMLQDEDIVIWDAMVISENGEVLPRMKGKFSHQGLQSERVYEGNEYFLKPLNYTNVYLTPVWLGMYKRNFLMNHHLWFERGILHEDELWMPISYLHAKHIVYFNEIIYRYRIRENSITNKKDHNFWKNMNDCIYIFNKLPHCFENLVENEKLLETLRANNSKRYLYAIVKYDAYRYKDLYKLINRISILKNARGLKDIVRSLVLCFNVVLFCKISKMVQNYKNEVTYGKN